MLRFGLWVGGLSLVLAGLTVGAMLWGRTLPGPDELQSAGFDVCDGKPCYMGITPGVTTWDEAEVKLKKMGATVVDNEIQMQIGEVQLIVVHGSYNSSIVSLGIGDRSYMTDKLPIVARFVEKYGTPCTVEWLNSSPELNIFYPSIQLHIIVKNDRLAIDSAVEDITMLNRPISISSCLQRLQKLDYSELSWSGFTSLNHYQQYRPAN